MSISDDCGSGCALYFLGDLGGASGPVDDCFLLAGDLCLALALLVGVDGGPTCVLDVDCFLLAGDFFLVVSFLVGVAGGPSCDLVRLMVIC